MMRGLPSPQPCAPPYTPPHTHTPRPPSATGSAWNVHTYPRGPRYIPVTWPMHPANPVTWPMHPADPITWPMHPADPINQLAHATPHSPRPLAPLALPPSATCRWPVPTNHRITSVDVCGSTAADGAPGHIFAASFSITFHTTSSVDGTTGWKTFGNSNGGVGGCSTGAGNSGGTTVTGTSSGGQLMYISGSQPGDALGSLCFQWNVYP